MLNKLIEKIVNYLLRLQNKLPKAIETLIQEPETPKEAIKKSLNNILNLIKELPTSQETYILKENIVKSIKCLK